MERVEVQLLTDGGNNAVVHMPGRKFPGVLVQGDSLSVLLGQAEDVEARLRGGDVAAALTEASGLADDLAAMLDRYEAAIEQQGIRRPYNKVTGRLGKQP